LLLKKGDFNNFVLVKSNKSISCKNNFVDKKGAKQNPGISAGVSLSLLSRTKH